MIAEETRRQREALHAKAAIRAKKFLPVFINFLFLFTK